MGQIEDLIKKAVEFRDARDWKQFHNPKDLAVALMLEAGEVAEHFHWKNEKEIEEYVGANKKEIGDELADVLNVIFLMSHDLGIDVADAFYEKMKQNEEKYPIDKAKGRNVKYNKL